MTTQEKHIRNKLPIQWLPLPQKLPLKTQCTPCFDIVRFYFKDMKLNTMSITNVRIAIASDSGSACK